MFSFFRKNKTVSVSRSKGGPTLLVKVKELLYSKGFKGADLYIDGDLDLRGLGLCDDDLMKLNIKLVTGSLDLSKNNLTSLDSLPKVIHGNCDLSSNRIKSLKGSPLWIGGFFDCSFNLIQNLEDSPKIVGAKYDSWSVMESIEDSREMPLGADFDCTKNPLSSIQGAPYLVIRDCFFPNKQLEVEYLAYLKDNADEVKKSKKNHATNITSQSSAYLI